MNIRHRDHNQVLLSGTLQLYLSTRQNRGAYFSGFSDVVAIWLIWVGNGFNIEKTNKPFVYKCVKVELEILSLNSLILYLKFFYRPESATIRIHINFLLSCISRIC